MITMQQIAEEAGVSRFTVSKVLNGDDSVKPASRELILQICEKHGYLPDNNAVGLVKGKTDIIAMIVPYITDDFYSEIIEITEKIAEHKGYRLIYKSSYNNAAKEADIIKSFLALKISALIIVPVVEHPDLHIHAIAAKHVPVIYLDRQIDPAGYCVLNDNVLSAEIMTKHLLEKTRKVAFLDSFYGPNNPTAVERRNGYLSAMKSYKASPSFIPCQNSSEEQDSEKYGYENMKAFLQNGGVCKAVFCITDATALGAIRAVGEAGLTPGKDILIAGHDDYRFSCYLTPSLTTMRQPKDQLGKACIELADALSRGKTISRRRRVFQSQLIIRESA